MKKAAGLIIISIIYLAGGCTVNINYSDEVQKLMEVDREYSRYAKEKGVAEAFYQYAADDATMLPSGAQPIFGKDAVKNSFGDEKLLLEWDPVDGKVDGELGYTWGKYKATVFDASGTEHSSFGKYVTIWTKQKDGSWKWIVDIGNQNPPPVEQ